MKRKKNKQHRKAEQKSKSYWPSTRRLKNDQVVYYIITKDEIENCNTDRLINDLRISPDNPYVRLAHGNVMFAVDGYDDDNRELADIPAFVRFMRKAAKSNPCWIYFTMPETNWLNCVLSTCCSSGKIDVDLNNEVVTVNVINGEIAAFFRRQIDDYETLCRHGGVDDETRVAFLEYIIEHYLPGFDSTMRAMMMGRYN